MRHVVVGAVLLLAACATEKEKPLLPAVDPAQMFLHELETRLLRAKTLHVVAESVSEGAVNSALTTEVFLGDGQKARVEVRGMFEGRQVSSWFICDGTSMKVRGKEATAAAPEVRDAVVVGLVRMGLLHNAAILVGGGAPDHAAGGARDWVRAERPTSGAERATDITYDVVVRHEVMGQATLSLLPDERPVKRVATVHFEEGDMHVEEKYTLFEIDAAVDDSVFSLAP